MRILIKCSSNGNKTKKLCVILIEQAKLETKKITIANCIFSKYQNPIHFSYKQILFCYCSSIKITNY